MSQWSPQTWLLRPGFFTRGHGVEAVEDMRRASARMPDSRPCFNGATARPWKTSALSRRKQHRPGIHAQFGHGGEAVENSPGHIRRGG